MTKTEVNLLENVFDSLDRLFDRESSAIDVYALLFATQTALAGSGSPNLGSYVKELDIIIRSGEPEDMQREKAITATNKLRSVLNELLPAS